MLAEFGDVGLMTGDVTINPSATCLVMTTEVSDSPNSEAQHCIDGPDFALYVVSWF
jgi:hypothetical protein